jgi:acetylornithine deacetylase/succinyl-diaminopimelate desuccinylase-like protein
MAQAQASQLFDRPAELLQRLIQFDTTNPPGNELACIQFIRGLLENAGIEARILAKDPVRPNVIARLRGEGRAAPLLLYGHVDVVTTAGQAWAVPPFEGRISDGYLWGRGALDMKGGVAMMLAAFLRAHHTKLSLPGDVIFAAVSDEEALGGVGAKYLVEEHAAEFGGVRYALGEFGGFTLTVTKKRFFPIQVAEKQACWMKATVRGPGGHGSMPVRGGAMAALARFLARLDRSRLPVHITPVARQMFGTMASAIGGARGKILAQLLNPQLTNALLSQLGAQSRTFDPLLHNTVSPTVLHGSAKINVIPGEVSVELDGRLLPGFKPEHILAELRAVSGPGVEYEVMHYDPGPADPDMGLFDTLAGVLHETDPRATAVPLMLTGTSDARFFSRLGIQTYGFTPMELPDDFRFIETIHSADERIPVEAVGFGTDAIYRVLQRFL